MQGSVFRAYDIRGVVGSEFQIDQVYNLACSIAAYCKNNNLDIKKVAVGRDGRIHSEVIEKQFIQGLLDSGISIVSLGECITPMIYFSEYYLAIDGAFMVTASHNPSEYNGIKIRLKKTPIAGASIQEIKNYFFSKKNVENIEKGQLENYDILNVYIDYLLKLFPHLKESSYPLLFDCANASVGPVMRKLIEKFKFLNADCMYENVDGTYPNHVADPTEIHTMQDLLIKVRERKLSFGIGFDGDADRMGVIMASGQLVGGDILLAGWADKILKEHPHATIVADIKCSDGLQEVVEKNGGNLMICPSGTAYIKSSMIKNNAVLGGELSCHFFFADRYFGFDDGVYASLRLLELVTTYKTSLEEIIKNFPYRESSSEIRIFCKENVHEIIAHVKEYFKSKIDYTISEIDGIRVRSVSGWGLMRPSNTQPVICLRFEAVSIDNLIEIKSEFVNALYPYFTPKLLQDKFNLKNN